MAHLDHEIRERARQYLRGSLSLRDFYLWLVPATWDVHLGDNSEAKRLAYELQHRINEFTNGDWTESELKELFREALGTYQLVVEGWIGVGQQTQCWAVSAARTLWIQPKHPARAELENATPRWAASWGHALHLA